MIHRKKNRLLYKDVHHLSVLQPCPALGPLLDGSVSASTSLAPSSVLGALSVSVLAFVH